MTLVELVITMSIILIISTLCFPKGNIEKYQFNSFIKQLCSNIRYVRNVNMMGNTNAYVYLEKSDDGGSFKLREDGKDIKQVYLPKDCKIKYERQMIKFKSDGTPLHSATTIKISHKNKEVEITIVPISGRVLIKEGKYET